MMVAVGMMVAVMMMAVGIVAGRIQMTGKIQWKVGPQRTNLALLVQRVNICE